MTLDRWTTFEKREQLLFVGSEFERARVWQEQGDLEKFRMALERALQLIDLTLHDSRWKDELPMIQGLRKEVGKFYSGENKGAVASLYRAL